MKRISLLWMVLLGVVSIAAISQADPDDAPRRGPPERDGAGGPPPPRPPKPPLEVALDADQDGDISADEMAGATAALQKLDKNGDGKLTPEEYRPRRGGPRDREASMGQRRRPRSGSDSPGTSPGDQDGDKPRDGDKNSGDKDLGDKKPGDKDPGPPRDAAPKDGE